MPSPTIVADGRIIGTWKRTFKKGTVVVTVNPFAPLSESRNHALSAAVERYGGFLSMPAAVATT
jgi:hypothetical protein